MAGPGKKEKEDEAVSETESVQQSGKKGKLFSILLIAAIVLALSGGGYAAYVLYIGPKFLSPNAKTQSGKKASKPGAGEKMGILISLKPFIVNLIDEKATRYLKITIDIELESNEEAVKAEAEKRVPQLRDTIIMLLTSKRYEEVMTLEGKLKMRDEIISRANQFLRKERIKNVYFSEFVVQ